MQNKYTQHILISLLGLLLFTSRLHAEGSKQLSPTATDLVNTNLGATLGRYDGTDVQRLYIHIKNAATEQVFLGFSQPRTNLGYPCTTGNATAYFRIKNAAGTVVFPTSGNANGQLITPNITGWATASAGPSQIVGASGYTATVFNPATFGNGDYYIEFSRTQGAFNATAFGLEWWDITVATKTPTPVALNGRVFTKNWALQTPAINCSGGNFTCGVADAFGQFDRPFNGSFHVYSPVDSVVTKVNFQNSGLRPIAFNIFFNDRGPGNTGNVVNDRKSAVGLSGTALYPLFLNDPDPADYPNGTTGVYATEPFYVSCDGTTGQFIVNVTKAGQVDVLIDLDRASGPFKYDSGTRDVILSLKVVPLMGEVPPFKRVVNWNGRDGLGAQYNMALPLDYSVNYAQGIFHLPIYDAEFMTAGFTFQPIRPIPPPSAVATLMYYDDSNIVAASLNSNPKVQLNGCLAPCHKWNNACYGDVMTINTWFFGSEDNRKREGLSPVCLVYAVDDSRTVTTPSLAISILNNDSGIAMDSSSISVAGLPGPTRGAIAVDILSRTITYTPNVGYFGLDSFRYRICDSNNYTCDTAWVFLTMPSVGGFTFNCGTATTTGTFTANGTAGQTGTVVVPMTGATAGSVTLNVTGTGFTGTLTTTLTAGQTSVTIPITYDGTGVNGSRTLTVTSTAGTGTCTKAVTVICPTIAAATTTIVQPTCSVATGTITVTAPSSGVTYSFDNGTTFQASATSNALTAGTYQVITRSTTSNCLSTAVSRTINPQPSTPSVPTLTVTQPTCSVATGTITVNTPTGSGITYSIDGVDYSNTSGVFSNLSPNTYTVTVKSAGGCLAASGTTGTINPSVTTPVVSLTQPTCAMPTGGSIVTDPTGAGYTYSLDGVDYTNTTGQFNNLAVGTYTVTVKSPAGCLSSGTTFNIVPPVPAPTVAVVHPTCTVLTGSLTVTAPTTDVTYSFDNGTTYQAAATLSGLAAGTYNVKVNNTVLGCASNATIAVINAPPTHPSVPTTSVTQPTCTVATGTITVTNPTSGVTYSFDNGATYQASATSAALPSGTYQVLVKDNVNGCESIANATTIDPQPTTPSVSTTTITQPTCAVATGTITVTNPSSGVTYSFDNGTTYQTSATSNPLPTGLHDVKVKSIVGGCESVAVTRTIDAQPIPPSVPTTTVSQPTCSVATGTITVTSPMSGVTYSFDNGTTYQAAATSNALSAGTYQVLVKDDVNGCASMANGTTINPQPNIPTTPTVTVTQPTCTVSTGTITVTSPSSGVSYSFDDGVTYQASATSSALPTGIYQVVVRDDASTCASTALATSINAQPSSPSVPTTTVTQPTCSVATGTITITNPSSGVTYSFDNGTSYQASEISNALPSGATYQVLMKNDVNGCVSTANATTIDPQPVTPTTPTFTYVAANCANTTGSISITSPFAAGFTYSVNGSDYSNTTGQFTGLGIGLHTVSVKSSGGCVSPSVPVTFTPWMSFNIKVLLEGPYQTATGLMRTTLNERGLLPGQTPIGPFAVATPRGQPFKGLPWNYAGTEGDTVTTYPTTVVDWVLISLRTDSTSLTNVFRAAGWLHRDGNVSFITPCFDIPDGSYFVLVEHRNHVGVLSPFKITAANKLITEDFTVNDSYIRTNPPSTGQKLKSLKWVMLSGDGKKELPTANYDVNFSDAQLWKIQSGIFDQFLYGDFNMDADINFSDSFLWKLNSGKYSGVPH